MHAPAHGEIEVSADEVTDGRSMINHRSPVGFRLLAGFFLLDGPLPGGDLDPDEPCLVESRDDRGPHGLLCGGNLKDGNGISWKSARFRREFFTFMVDVCVLSTVADAILGTEGRTGIVAKGT